MSTLSDWKDKPLFTPGPLTTSRSVKEAMLRDLGSRDSAFIGVVRSIRHRLLALGGVSEERFAAIPLQGSGTYALEAVLSSCVPADGRLLVGINGAYGARLAAIAKRLGISVETISVQEDQPITVEAIREKLNTDPVITHVSVCHCETTSGILNPVEAIGQAVHAAGRLFYVDAMSSFGAIPLSLESACVDYLVTSSNKCIEGVPGFGIVLARLAPFLAAEGCARSVVLDLHAQYAGLESNGQFRFTPPTHTLLAFHQALNELELEGGVAARGDRYRANHAALLEGMRALGFEEYLNESLQGPIITSFVYPDHANFNFARFYEALSDEGKVIYPGKVGNADCFRIGTIGRLNTADIHDLVATIARVKARLGF